MRAGLAQGFSPANKACKIQGALAPGLFAPLCRNAQLRKGFDSPEVLMADTPQSGLLAVRLVTPDRILLDATAEAVELPSMSASIEPLHATPPLLPTLRSRPAPP